MDVGEPNRSMTRIARSPADVLRLVVAAAVLVALLVAEWLFGDTLVAFASDLLRGLDAVPDWMVDVVVIGSRLLAVVILGGGLVVSLWRRTRWRMLLTVVAAGALAAVLVIVRDLLLDTAHGATPVDVDVKLGPFTDSRFPTTAGLAVTTAVLTAAAPWLSRRWRRGGWVLVIGLTLSMLLTATMSFDPFTAFATGWASGAAVLVALGAPSRRPTTQAVVDGLSHVGLPLVELRPASVDARGSTPYFGTATDGGALFVKALGDDERSADLLFRLYRSLQPRDFGDERPFSSLRRSVEHEALMALAARDLGIRTPRLRAFASADPHGYVLAYDAIEGRSLDRVEPEEVDDGMLGAIWTLVGELQRHRIAHRDLRLANIFLDDGGEPWLIDFGFSELAASDVLLATDVAELVASSSVYVGAERAVGQAVAAVGPARLAQAGDRMTMWALSGATRSAQKERPGLLAELRERVAAASSAVDR